MAVTLRDVARVAGVSPIAVSKVLHGKGGSARVSVEKAAIIREVASQLSYTPNTLARSLRGGKTHNIGLIFEEFGPIGKGSRYMGLLLDGISSVCFEAGYSLTLCGKLASNSLAIIGDGRFDGVVWAKSEVDEPVLAAARRSGVKVVHLHVPPSRATDPVGNYLCCDNEEGISLALSHLKLLGHEKVAYANEGENQDVAEAYERADLFLKIGRSLGLDVDVSYNGTWCLDGRGMREWIESHRDVTGIILRTENLSLAFYKMVATMGLSIPHDYSVIGFDSTEFCDAIRPNLTAISQPIKEMASQAAKLLIQSIEGQDIPGQRLVYPCGLDIRESTSIPHSQSREQKSCNAKHLH